MSGLEPEGTSASRRIPAWIRLGYTAFLGLLVPVYWWHYGPANFLWGSDIALFLVLASLWLARALPNSMMAIGVLPFEIAWCADFLAGSRLFGMAAYMFEADRPVFLRALSLFHLFLPVLIIYLLRRLGYDRRALLAQTLLTWVVLPATYLLTDPADNINRVFGLGDPPQTWTHPLAWLSLQMLALPLVVYWPMHRLLGRICRTP